MRVPLRCVMIGFVGGAVVGIAVGAEPALPTLRKACEGKLRIGVAMNANQFTGRDKAAAEIIATQFSTITPENAMKWDALHPEPGRFRFDEADQYVEFGERNGMFIVGHTLIWHSQTPRWVFENSTGQPADRETLIERMRQHIQTVVGRYKGRVNGWDVVNEALADDGTLRDSPWRRIIGDDYIELAFRFAHEADPDAELYYNDYGIEAGRKRDGAIELIRRLRSKGVPITAIGMQNHISLKWPDADALDEAIREFGATGVKVMSTELDVDVCRHATTS